MKNELKQNHERKNKDEAAMFQGTRNQENTESQMKKKKLLLFKLLHYVLEMCRTFSRGNCAHEME